MEPPKIRIHKFEHTVAIKWPDHDCWWVIEPEMPGSGGWAHPAACFDGPEAPEWIDPAASHHTDLSRRTNAIRRDLASVEQVLQGLERYPWS